MRKGADCLSKWVGESERQLRLLFDQVIYCLVRISKLVIFFLINAPSIFFLVALFYLSYVSHPLTIFILVFIQAFSMRPAIIFFDEIDGLAPVRSSRQDQIHSSIVSTLLALMDGLDSRGEIVVIGATNRIDAIDPALRRPGRFDREFQFALPDRNVSYF